MTDNRKLAADLLESAANIVCNERGSQHGGVEDSFTMIAQLWAVYLTHTNKHHHNNDVLVVVTSDDVAQLMSLLKKSRFVYGKRYNIDNFVDDLGYVSLAGMMVLSEEGYKNAK